MNKQVGIRPKPLRQPMIAIVFGTQQEYIRAMQSRLGAAAKATAGVYMPEDNRLYIFDMLGGRDADWFRKASAASAKSPDEIALLLASDTVSTVIHEGVHQVAYNTGFHDRNVRQPIWLVEGLATLLEVPDMDSKNRWAGMGQINWDRAEELKRDWAKVSPESVEKSLPATAGFDRRANPASLTPKLGAHLLSHQGEEERVSRLRRSCESSSADGRIQRRGSIARFRVGVRQKPRPARRGVPPVHRKKRLSKRAARPIGRESLKEPLTILLAAFGTTIPKHAKATRCLNKVFASGSPMPTSDGPSLRRSFANGLRKRERSSIHPRTLFAVSRTRGSKALWCNRFTSLQVRNSADWSVLKVGAEDLFRPAALGSTARLRSTSRHARRPGVAGPRDHFRWPWK